MPLQYDPQKLDARFDKESPYWKKLYQETSEKNSVYNNKKYRRQYVLEMLEPGSGTVLDLGCGSGDFFEPLEKLGYRVVGLDSSWEMAKLASSTANNLKQSRVVRGDSLKLPFADNTFDALIAVGLLEYLPDDENFLKIVGGVVKPGGKIVITLRNSLCLERRLWKLYQKLFGINVGKTDYFYREHNPKHFKSLLQSLGFVNINLRFCHFYPFPWPLDKLFRSGNDFLGHKMEKYFSNSKINFLGSTCIAAFEAPAKILRDGRANQDGWFDRLVCPLTGRALKKIDPEKLAGINDKIREGKIFNQQKVGLSEPLADAYITEDEKIVYPVKDNIPILLEKESIALF